MDIYLENLQLILNSEITEEEKQKQLLELIESIENDLLLEAKERENLVKQIETTSNNIMLNLDLYNLKKLRNFTKKVLIACSILGLPGTVIMCCFYYNCIANCEQTLEVIKNSLNLPNIYVSAFVLGNLITIPLGIFVSFDVLSIQEFQKYLSYNKKINSYQRRLKDNHK